MSRADAPWRASTHARPWRNRLPGSESTPGSADAVYRWRGVERALMPVEDRRALRHGVHQMRTPLDGREAVRDDGDLWDGDAVELHGVEYGILPQDEALLRLTRLGILVVIDLPEHHRDPACALADAPPGSFDLVERGPDGEASPSPLTATR